MTRDEEIQEALDRRGASAAGGGADEAAYRVVFAALAEDDGFALPAGFADAMAARLLPGPVRASPFERYVLPVLFAAACVMSVPLVVVTLGGALAAVAGPEGGTSGLHAVAAITLALVVIAGADRLARRAGLAPG